MSRVGYKKWELSFQFEPFTWLAKSLELAKEMQSFYGQLVLISTFTARIEAIFQSLEKDYY